MIKKIYCLAFTIFINCSYQDCGELVFDKNSRTTYLKNSLFTGKCKSFYFSGDLRSNEQYLNGKDHGEWIFYFKNGVIQTKGSFDKGKRIGRWEYYYENGKVWKINFFDNFGSKTGKWLEYDKKGELMKQIKY